MTIYRLIAPDWLLEQNPSIRKVLEGQFTVDEIKAYNKEGYNVYYLPNNPSSFTPGTVVNGSHIDRFNYVFVDYDSKALKYANTEDFLAKVGSSTLVPSQVVNSGNGVHVYWRVSDLDVKSYLRLQRRLMRHLNTDEATCSIYQLLRYPGTWNTKQKDKFKLCVLASVSDKVYTCEELDKLLPKITPEDEVFCQQHYDRTYNVNPDIKVTDVIPPKFGKFIRENSEAKELWATTTDDRSKADYRLGHLMFANGFNKDEASSVLVNTAKALTRAPVHRVNYAKNIIDKIWTYEDTGNSEELNLSLSIERILSKSGDTIKGTRFPCHKRIDNTAHGFRLGQVMGLVAGAGVGKTAWALNAFRWFAQNNPDYHHFFIPLEQPANEIADRWKTMCGDDTTLHSKIHIMSNYDEDNNFRHLSLSDIEEYIIKFQKVTGHKVGCVVIDHIGVLKKKGAKDENQDLMTICHTMKAFAIRTNTFLIMQSQTNREKAGIGDLELNKDAAYGTLFFESYCDYLVTLWQPLKRCHNESACPTVTAFKFCKIRHKKATKDVIQEDVPYYLYFDSDKELLADMTQDQITSFNFFLPRATNKRKLDRKTELITYQAVPYNSKETNVQKNSN